VPERRANGAGGPTPLLLAFMDGLRAAYLVAAALAALGVVTSLLRGGRTKSEERGAKSEG
jgi:hypothetical protein